MSERHVDGLDATSFAALGTPRLVYIKPVRDAAGRTTFQVHAANGDPLGGEASYEAALAKAHVNELMAVSVH